MLRSGFWENAIKAWRVLGAGTGFEYALAVLHQRASTVLRRKTAVMPATQGSHAEPVTKVTPASNAVAALESSDSEQPDDVTRVMTAIAAGDVRAIVTQIRKFLGCSQAKASAVRKQLDPETFLS